MEQFNYSIFGNNDNTLWFSHTTNQNFLVQPFINRPSYWRLHFWDIHYWLRICSICFKFFYNFLELYWYDFKLYSHITKFHSNINRASNVASFCIICEHKQFYYYNDFRYHYGGDLCVQNYCSNNTIAFHNRLDPNKC